MTTTANFSADETQNAVEQLYCSTNLTAEMLGQLTFISVFNIFLSITAFFGNALILVALYKESSLHSPSKVLLSNLAATDLCVGLIIEPLTVIYLRPYASHGAMRKDDDDDDEPSSI